MISTQEVARRLGVSYRQVDYAVRSGRLRPSVPAQGYGSARRWSEEDLEAARRFFAQGGCIPWAESVPSYP